MDRGRTVRVLYADVDGTMVGPLGNLLWDSHRTPTVAAAEALVRAVREGLEVVALTGRTRAAMFEFARVLGLQSWICELGGIRVYDRGDTVVHEHGAFPGGGVPTAELHRAVELLLEAYPGRLEEHSPWNATRESSFLLRGDVFSEEVINTWIDYKIQKEVNPVRLRPHPLEFALYFDI